MNAYSLDLRQRILRACDQWLGSQRGIVASIPRRAVQNGAVHSTGAAHSVDNFISASSQKRPRLDPVKPAVVARGPDFQVAYRTQVVPGSRLSMDQGGEPKLPHTV
jgi:hypothetical protein